MRDGNIREKFGLPFCTHMFTNTMDKVQYFTQCADGVLALLHLLRHQPADGHQTLRDAAAVFHNVFFSRLPKINTCTIPGDAGLLLSRSGIHCIYCYI